MDGLQIFWQNDRTAEVWTSRGAVPIRLLVVLTQEELGWAGMEAALKLATSVAEVAGLPVKVVGEPGV